MKANFSDKFKILLLGKPYLALDSKWNVLKDPSCLKGCSSIQTLLFYRTIRSSPTLDTSFLNGGRNCPSFCSCTSRGPRSNPTAPSSRTERKSASRSRWTCLPTSPPTSKFLTPTSGPTTVASTTKLPATTTTAAAIITTAMTTTAISPAMKMATPT